MPPFFGIVWLPAAFKPRLDGLGEVIGRDLRIERRVSDPVDGVNGDISELNHWL